MFRFTVLALVLASGDLRGCGMLSPAVQGSGVAAREDRQVGPFEQVELDGSPSVEIEVGPAQSVRVEGDDNIVPLITTVVADNTLKISSNDSYRAKTPIKVSITVPRLVGVAGLGSGSIGARGVVADNFAASLHGSGAIQLAGTATALAASLDGSGSLAAAALATARVAVSINGSGGADVHATEQVVANINGSGSVRYGGGATDIVQSISGSGTVAPR
jgi:hypothetical protein